MLCMQEAQAQFLACLVLHALLEVTYCTASCSPGVPQHFWAQGPSTELSSLCDWISSGVAPGSSEQA